MTGQIYLPKKMSPLALSAIMKKVQSRTASFEEARLFYTIMSSDMMNRILSTAELGAWGVAGELIDLDSARRAAADAPPDSGRVPEKNQHNRWETHQDGPKEI